MSFVIDATSFWALPVIEASHPAAKIPNRAAPDPTPGSGTRASLQPWVSEFRRSLEPLRVLEAGWAGQGSCAIESKLFYRVEQYLAVALAGIPNPKLPYVVPTASGGLQIEWHREQIELEVLFEPDGEISALFEDHEQKLEIEEYGNAATNLLFRWAPRAAQTRSHVPDVEIPQPAAAFQLVA